MSSNIRPCPCCGQDTPFPTEPGEWEYNEHVTWPDDIRPPWRRAQIRVPADDVRDGDEGLRFHPYGFGEDEYYKEGPSDEPQWWPGNAAWRRFNP